MYLFCAKVDFYDRGRGGFFVIFLNERMFRNNAKYYTRTNLRLIIWKLLSCFLSMKYSFEIVAVYFLSYFYEYYMSVVEKIIFVI